MTTGPVLFVGGSGTVGRHAVGWFRKRHPGVPVLVGGRDLEAAGRVATEAGDAAAVAIDLDTPGLGLDDDVAVSAVVMLAPDSALTGLRYAQDSGIPYLNISTGLIEVGPDVALFTHRPAAAPVVLDSHWGGGAALFLALDAARACQTVRSIRVGVVLDERDPAGPSALEDMERLGRASAAFAFAGGRRVWLSSDDADGQVTAIDGRLLSANAFSSLDIISLYAATGASDVRFDLATGESSSRRRGGAVAAEIVVDVDGEADGAPVRTRSVLEFAHGQASLTALSVVILLSALLGRDGRAPAAPGLYLPELLSDADPFLDELRDAGAVITQDPR